jgi:hypothetical protein
MIRILNITRWEIRPLCCWVSEVMFRWWIILFYFSVVNEVFAKFHSHIQVHRKKQWIFANFRTDCRLSKNFILHPTPSLFILIKVVLVNRCSN